MIKMKDKVEVEVLKTIDLTLILIMKVMDTLVFLSHKMIIETMGNNLIDLKVIQINNDASTII